MSIQGYRNLIKSNLFNDDSFQPLLKRSDEYRKTTQVALIHFQGINKNFEGFQSAFEKLIVDFEEDVEISEISVPQYYQKYIQLYRNIWSQQKSFDDKLGNNLKELNALCDSLFSNFSNTILSFQEIIRSYKTHEQVLFELSKKYFRTHKSMLTAIEQYKQTFTDVKIIYNMDEKNKRYNLCETVYKALTEELGNIQGKVSQLSIEKADIVDAYKGIDKEFTLTLKAIGSKLIAICKAFVSDFCQMEKIIITYLAEKKFTLEKVELKTFFNSDSKLNFEDYFDVQIDPHKLDCYPVFVVYYKHFKEEYYPQLGNLLQSVMKETCQKIQNRKRLSKKVLQFTCNFFKIYEKGYYVGLKEVFTNFQKVKKRLTELFGGRLGSFLKSIHSIFQLSIGINEKLIKRTLARLKTVEAHVIEELKILELFQKEFKTNIESFIQKKKLIKGVNQKEEFTEEEPNDSDMHMLKQSFGEKAQHLSILIDGFVDKQKKNYQLLKLQYNTIVNDISASTNQFYSLCCEYQELYFGSEEFMKNYKKYEQDIDATLENERKFFREINFGTLLTDSGKITFDSEMNKVEEYKKLKKPVNVAIDLKKEKEKVAEAAKEKEKMENLSEKSVDPKAEQTKGEKNEKGEKGEKGEKNDGVSKHQQFLSTKINFLPDERFYKSFSCALSDKILLSGRVYITNKRICFHSSFNPSNVFFGDTFLQIPKQDIKKIEKKVNAIIFDNSISITTVHGEVFLTSFFSRNQAYKIMCQALEIDIDECMFEPQTIEDNPVSEIKQSPQDDDMPEASISERLQSITKLLPVFPYKQLFRTQFAYPGFTAYKFLKTFDVGCEITINRTTFKNFAVYLKECQEHKDYVYQEWTPSAPVDFLNPKTIKSSTPLCFNRKINCMVPVANTGVPFMPKHAKSNEDQNLYIVSKDKYVFQSTIQNSGVPYSDAFNLKLLRIVQTINQNCCQMTVSLHINFLSNTMMKGIIESKSTEQTKGAFTKMESEAKKYLNSLQRAKLRQKAQSKDVALSGNVNISQSFEKQIAELKESQQKLREQVKVSNMKLQQGKKILIGSLVLNILLILILLC